MRRRAALGTLLGALAAAVLSACGAGPGAPSTDARLLVTRDFGRTVLVDEDHPEIRGADTVMRLLQRNAKVTTRFGGGFVQSIDGVAGGEDGGRPVDWLFYVEGVFADRGASDVRVADGDTIWWDHHDWGSGPASGSAVVGAFPAPFAGAVTRLACLPAAAAVCDRVRETLTRAGARVRAAAPADAGRGRDPAVLVGTLARLRATHAGRMLADGPQTSGVYARASRAGTSLELLDARGRGVRRLRAGAGLVAATHDAGGPAIWTITGTDDAGVDAAAGALSATALARRFAVAVEPAGPTALPVEAGS